MKGQGVALRCLQAITISIAHTYRLHRPSPQLIYQIYRRIYRSQSISKGVTDPMHGCAILAVILHPLTKSRTGWIPIAVTVSGVFWKAVVLLCGCDLLSRPKWISNQWNDALAVWSLESSCFVGTNLNVWELMLKVYVTDMKSSRFRQSHTRIKQHCK